MGSVNYMIPVDAMTLSDQKTYRMRALAAGLARASEKKIGNLDAEIPELVGVVDPEQRKQAVLNYLNGGGWPRSIDGREFQPVLDAGTALDQWNTAALAAVGTFYSCFQAVAAPVMANNKLAVFYGVSIETVPVPVSRLTFRSGGATGNIIGVFDLERITEGEQTIGFFSEPITIDPTFTFAAQVLCRIATGVMARVKLNSFVFESAGLTISS